VRGLDASGGFASGEWARTNNVSSLADSEAPGTAVADWWTSPHPMALPVDVCDQLRAACTRPPDAGGNGHYWIVTDELPDSVLLPLISRVQAANTRWWRLDVDEYAVRVKRYVPGLGHAWHQDWHPRRNGPRAKLVGIAQLSDGDEYAGGDLVLEHHGREMAAPVDRGTFLAMPSWIRHTVLPVTDGERWSVNVTALGPQLR
jgi:PKHD-type hydroxylase